MAKIKQSYKIPHTINVKDGLDTPIALKFGRIGLSVPVPMNLILMNITLIIVYVSLITYMIKSNYGILAPLLFTISFVPLSRILLRKMRTGERGYKMLWPALKYYPSYKFRKINTRGTAKEKEVVDLKNVIGLEEINPKTGIARFTNGDTGVAIKVIGNGSKSLFDNEVEQIVLAFDQFLRELDLGVHLIVDMKEGQQNCSKQIESHEKKKDNNINNNPTISMILNNRINTLKGIERNFRTTEYTTYLRSNDIRSLESTIKMLKQTNSNTLFKYFKIAFDEEVFEKYKNYYSLK